MRHDKGSSVNYCGMLLQQPGRGWAIWGCIESRPTRMASALTCGDKMDRLPTVFFGHGTPMVALWENDTTVAWRTILNGMPKPRAILCISAHWLTRGISITAQEQPPTIHDFGNFLRAMHEIIYPARGDAHLVRRVAELLAPDPVVLSSDWGFDHGCWTVLMKALPDADVPVVQLSMDVRRTPQQHFELGRRLRPLRDEGVLIMGSGNIVHDLSGVIRQNDVPAHPYAENFGKMIRTAIRENDSQTAIDFAALGADAVRSVPTPDHYWPLLYVLGARHDDDCPDFAVDYVQYGSIDMMTVSLSAGA